MEYSSVNNYGTIINISGGSKNGLEKALAASRTPSTKNANIKAKDRSKMRKQRLQRSLAIEKTRKMALKREKAEKKKKKQQQQEASHQQHRTAVKKQQHQPSVQEQQQPQLPTVDGSPLPNQPPACRLTGRPMCRHPNCTKAGVPRLGPGQLLVLSGKSDYKKISEPMDIDEEVLLSSPKHD